MTHAEAAALAGGSLAADLPRVSLDVYRRGVPLATERGIVITGTKLEFGLAADEVLTRARPGSWLAAAWQPGRPQRSLGKQFLRDWSSGLGWDRRPPGPSIPPDMAAAPARYLQPYTRLTGDGG